MEAVAIRSAAYFQANKERLREKKRNRKPWLKASAKKYQRDWMRRNYQRPSVREAQQRWREANREKLRLYNRLYFKNHPDYWRKHRYPKNKSQEFSAHRKQLMERYRDELRDCYIRGLVRRGASIEVPHALIELKRAQIRLSRQIKQTNTIWQKQPNHQ